MKIAVLFDSRQGLVKKAASAIAEAVGGEMVDMHVPGNIRDWDLLFVGVSTKSGRVEADVLDYLDQLPVNNIRCAALFSIDRKEQDHLALADNCLKHKNIAVYYRHLVLPGPSLFHNHGHPDEADLQKAREYGLEVAGRLQKTE